MNLEKGINILFEKLVDENAIDVSEDFLLNNFDIYSDIQAIREKIINSINFRHFFNTFRHLCLL